MKFSEFNKLQNQTNASKLLHLPHIEELTYQGVIQIQNAISILSDVRDELAGNTKAHINTTMKIDGNPSIICGYHPETNEFFVAKKSLFNTDPQYYTSEQSVLSSNLPPALQERFIAALRWLPLVVKSGIYQGDLLHIRTDIESDVIDGKAYWLMHPNTIVYAVPQDSEFGEYLVKTNIGVVFHTKYTGNTLSSLVASSDVTSKDFEYNDNVWVSSAEIHNFAGTVTLTKGETQDLTDLINTARKIFNKIASNTLLILSENKELTKLIEIYNNSHIRQGMFITDSKKHVSGLIDWIHNRYEAEAEKRVTARGKQTQYDKRAEILKFFDESNIDNLSMLFDLQIALVNAKVMIINHFDKISNMKTFIKTDDGFKVTGSEGVVVVDKLSSNTVKLVDRLSFSHYNFSSRVIKGW
jgi:hypothetical protein